MKKKSLNWLSGLLFVVVIVAACMLIKQKQEQQLLAEENKALETQLEAQSVTIDEYEELIAMYEDEGNGIKAHGALHVENGKLVDENGDSLQLRGFSSHGITWYPRYINAGAMQTIRDYGANVFRVAMYSGQEQGYILEPEKSADFAYIAVENILAEDMYAIIDWHVLRDENPLLHVEEAKAFFGEFSSHYGNQPGIIYEICNEPNGNTTWQDIVTYANEIIPIIRNNAPDAVIIVGTPNYSTDLRSAIENPLQYDNIMYAYHTYIDVSTPGEYSSNTLETALDMQFPVFVSEWGITYKNQWQTESDDTDLARIEGEVYEQRVEEFLALLKEHGIGWCNWSLSNKDEIYSAIRSECNKLSGWTEEDMTVSGKIVFEALQD